MEQWGMHRICNIDLNNDAAQLDLFIENAVLNTRPARDEIVRRRFVECSEPRNDSHKNDNIQDYETYGRKQCTVARQLLLDFTTDITHLIRPHSVVGALNTEIFGFFREERKLNDVCSVLYKRNIKYLGDLIQLKEAFVIGLPGMNHNKAEIMKERLTVFNFHFGTRLPGWQRPREPLGYVTFRSSLIADFLKC